MLHVLISTFCYICNYTKMYLLYPHGPIDCPLFLEDRPIVLRRPTRDKAIVITEYAVFLYYKLQVFCNIDAEVFFS